MSNPAEIYERFMVPAIFAPSAASLVAYVNPARGDRVLDLACGTGIVARTVASALNGDCVITGLDPQPPMLDVARTIAERDHLDATWVEGRAEQMPFEDGVFDVVLCQQGLQFAVDRQVAVNEIHRVLKRAGNVGIAVMQDISLHPFYDTLAATVQRHLGVPVLHQPFTLGDAGELESLFSTANFQRIELQPVTIQAHFHDPDQYLNSQIEIASVAIRSGWDLDRQRRVQLVEAIRADMAQALRDHTRGDLLVIPWHIYLLRATRG